MQRDDQARLRVDAVTKRFGGLVAVSEVSFVVPERKIVSIVGPNGAGKTTLFNVISGALPADGGKVFLGDQEVSGLAPDKLSNLGLARTFQNVRLFDHLNAFLMRFSNSSATAKTGARRSSAPSIYWTG